MTNFEDLLKRKRAEWGEKFDPSSLAAQFVPYFNSKERIEVNTFGEVKRGRVGVTTGWKPVFLLMLTRRSIGSIYTLSSTDKILRSIPERSHRPRRRRG